MREFNTTGPCDPDKHYTVMREALVAVCTEKVKRAVISPSLRPGKQEKPPFSNCC